MTEPRSTKPAWYRAVMHRFARPLHIGACLVLLSLSVTFLGELLGLGDESQGTVNETRRTLAESTALHLSTLARIDDKGAIDYAIFSLVSRSDTVKAASLMRSSGRVVAQHGEIGLLSNFAPLSTQSHVSVPIFSDEHPWGELQLVFTPERSILGELAGLLFYTLSSLIAFTLLLNKAFIQLDPNSAVPSRVETAFNLFSSGVVILDDQLRVIMANQAASEMGSCSPDSLLGTTLGSWNWQSEAQWQEPWATALHSGLIVSDQPLKLEMSDGSLRVLMISCAQIGDSEEGSRGVMVTLDDVSSIEKKNTELAATLQELRSSQALISAKNLELERLATTDALTGISNRRVLMETLAREYKYAVENSSPLSCIMSDIDHFKSVNDTYGHGVGDDVIKAVAEVLSAACEDHQTVGRYGGEEFVVVLPGTDAAAAAELAEEARSTVQLLATGDRLAVNRLSSSFGVADMSSGADQANTLVDLADQALYAAKQGGRNRVCIYDPSRESIKASLEDPPASRSVSSESTDARLNELETLLKEREQELGNLREFDALTGIPMRTLFLQRLDSELTRARRNSESIGVVSFELRNIERLISTFGHNAADALVLSVINRLQQGLRVTDLVTQISAEHALSRITHNEYGILLSDIGSAEGALIVITRLKKLLFQPFLVGTQKVYVGVNIGVALSEMREQSASELFAQAGDARLKASQKPDKVSHAFFMKTLDDQSNDYIKLESDLHDALDSGQLEVYYQPKFNLKQRRITGMEALIRWQHKTRGFVPPDVFVAVAESNGLIERLSTFVIEQTLKQIVSWEAMGFQQLVVSVNVSPMQLRAESLVEGILTALERTGVDGCNLEVELTETSVLDNPEQARIALDTLRASGISISIDDFGTGYTSLSLLSRLPIDIIKIDRSFIAAMHESEQDQLIVRSMVAMAHTLGLSVVGEGVETNEDLEALAAIGCDVVQGYLISYPLPAEQITEFLESQRVVQNYRRSGS